MWYLRIQHARNEAVLMSAFQLLTRMEKAAEKASGVRGAITRCRVQLMRNLLLRAVIYYPLVHLMNSLKAGEAL
jgi:hypothetical protein